MTNREHILKVIAGLDDNTLCDVWTELPDEVGNKQPIDGVCDTCPENLNGDCGCDYTVCQDHTVAWMNAEVRPR